MRPFPLPISHCRFMLVLALGAGVAACAAPAPDKGGLLGYGTPGVSGYVQDDRDSTLQAELERCRGVGLPDAAGQAGRQTGGLEAACNQLRRTAHNQPGNGVQPARAP